ncbi:MAG: hypothetical protein ABSG68_05565 [Thermoguttaceae bacterium]|jgi:hypothetical protein
MVHQNFIPLLDFSLIADLEDEAARRGISIREAYEKEMAARVELGRITPCNTELLKIATRHPAPQEWYDE